MIHYIEINIFAIILGLILLAQERRLSSKNETSQIIMNSMLVLLITLSISDIAAVCYRGKSYIGVETSNIIYFITLALGCYLWFVFILVKMGYAKNLYKSVLTTGLPITALCVAMLFNPATDYFFSVDEALSYHRGPGVLLTWVVEWAYMLCAIAVNFRAIFKEKRRYKRSEYVGYLVFFMPIAVAAVSQMIFYGTTTLQIGYSIALLMVYFNRQYFQIRTDDLTGTNNKNAFLHFIDSLDSQATPSHMSLFMVDIDNFKALNDTYGHITGDKALRAVSAALQNAAATISPNKITLYRYGGDEFVFVGNELTEEEYTALPKTINSEVQKLNTQDEHLNEPYTLSVSIGQAYATCDSSNDFNELVKAADEDMYKAKKVEK